MFTFGKTIFFLKYLYIVGILISVFIFWPASPVPFEIPKIIFVLRWIEILLIVAIVGTFGHPNDNKIDKFLVILVVCYWLWVVLSIVTGVDIPRSIIGNYYRGDGLILLSHLAVLFLITVIFAKSSWVRPIICTWSLTAVMLGIISIILWILHALGFSWIPVWEGGFGGTFGNPNFLTGYLLVTLPFTAYFFDRKKGYLWKAAIMIQIIGIFLTKAWIGIFGVIAFLTIWLSLKTPKLKIAIILIGIILISVGIFRYYDLQKRNTPNTNIIAESRERIFMKGLLAWEKRPLAGYGLANFDRAFENVDWPIHLNNDVYVDKAHSSLLEVLVTSGVFGLSLYLAIIIRTIFLLVKNKDPISGYLLGAFLFTVIHMQTNVISISEELVFWITVALSSKFGEVGNTSSKKT